MKILSSMLLTLACSLVWGSVLHLSAESGRTEFQAIGYPASLRIEGHGMGPEGDLKLEKTGAVYKVQGELSVALKSLDSGIELRDRHMKNKYLEVDKYQFGVLLIDELELTQGLPEGVLVKYPFKGRLQVHGAERALQGEAELKRMNGRVSIKSAFGLNITDYGISIPKFAGITVAEEVKIQVSSEVSWSEKL